MKTTLKILAVLVAIVGFSAASYAQTNIATADASATIKAPITISKSTNMVFGTIIPSTTGTGTVALSTTGGRTPSAGVTLVGEGASAATFAVSGEGSSEFTVAINKTTFDVTHTDGTTTMTINTFTRDPSANGTLSSGSGTVKIGATLNLAQNQKAGSYTLTDAFTVTVNYP
jgi:hypothetical protein